MSLFSFKYLLRACPIGAFSSRHANAKTTSRSNFGEKKTLTAGYLCPELYCGLLKIGKPVDYWGLGLTLHQLYQDGAWNMIVHKQGSNREDVEYHSGMPKVNNIETSLGEVLVGLLKIKPEDRWSFDDVRKSSWFVTAKGDGNKGKRPSWLHPACLSTGTQRALATVSFIRIGQRQPRVNLCPHLHGPKNIEKLLC